MASCVKSLVNEEKINLRKKHITRLNLLKINILELKDEQDCELRRSKEPIILNKYLKLKSKQD